MISQKKKNSNVRKWTLRSVNTRCRVNVYLWMHSLDAWPMNKGIHTGQATRLLDALHLPPKQWNQYIPREDAMGTFTPSCGYYCHLLAPK